MWKIAFVLFVIVFELNSVIAQIRPPPKVTLPSGGSLLGSFMHSSKRKIIQAFRGIPYAKPPVGPLRFSAPEPYAAWSGEKLADHDAQPCPQQDHFGIEREYFGNEDCLYLNVYTPQKRLENITLSVMVFFHGGSFLYGGSTSEIYGPQRLLDNNIVLVTSNYRLGPLGFMTTGTADSPGNYGLKDQLMVLKWIKENIKAFGGNPDDVTLFGHSAGAASVAYHLAAPLSKGLFQKAIMQSGNSFDPWAIVNTEMAVDRARRIGEILNCTETDGIDRFPEMMECLRGKSPQDIISTLEDFYIIDGEPMNIFGPVLEPAELPGGFLTQHPRDLESTHGANVPVIIGVTSDEGVFKSAPILYSYKQEFEDNFAELLPFMLVYDEIPVSAQDGVTSKIGSFYFKSGLKWSRRKHQNLTSMFGDRLFYSGMDQFLQNRLANQNSSSTYVYVFDHRGPKSLSQLYGGGLTYYGVAHGDELPFLFPLAQDYLRGSKNDGKMRWAMPRMWADFAKTGNPTPKKYKGMPKWIPATKYPLNYARLGNKENKNNWYADDHNKINQKKEAGEMAKNDNSQKLDNDIIDAKVKQRHRVQEIDENEEFIAAMEESFVPDADAKSTHKRARRGRKHHNKSKKSKKSKGAKQDYYIIVGNEVGLVEDRMEFWRNLEPSLKIVETYVETEQEPEVEAQTEAQVEVQTQAQVEVQAQAQVEAQIQAQTEAEKEVVTETVVKKKGMN